jgi:hypothetical protein
MQAYKYDLLIVLYVYFMHVLQRKNKKGTAVKVLKIDISFSNKYIFN